MPLDSSNLEPSEENRPLRRFSFFGFSQLSAFFHTGLIPRYQYCNIFFTVCIHNPGEQLISSFYNECVAE